VPELSAFEVEMAIEKLIRQINHQVLIKSQQNRLKQGVEQFVLRSINLSIIVPIYKKDDKTGCSNYRGISLLPTRYKIVSNILLSRLTPYAEEINGDHQCEF
jgi:hypothetical protein